MGWLYQYRKPRDMKEWFREQYNVEKDHASQRILDSAIVNLREGYAAVEQINRQTGERKVTAAVIMFDFNRRTDGTEFGYKDMSEFSGPYQTNCPKRILDLLTPTDHEYAVQWRATCRERLERRASRKVSNGDHIRLGQPMHFTNGADYQIFRIEERGRLRALHQNGQPGPMVRLSKWRDRDWEKVPADEIAALQAEGLRRGEMERLLYEVRRNDPAAQQVSVTTFEAEDGTDVTIHFRPTPGVFWSEAPWVVTSGDQEHCFQSEGEALREARERVMASGVAPEPEASDQNDAELDAPQP